MWYFLPGSVLKQASLLIAKWSMVTVFNRKINILMAAAYWKPNPSSSFWTLMRSVEQSFLVATNLVDSGELCFSFSSFVMFVLSCYGKKHEAINNIYGDWSSMIK